MHRLTEWIVFLSAPNKFSKMHNRMPCNDNVVPCLFSIWILLLFLIHDLCSVACRSYFMVRHFRFGNSYRDSKLYQFVCSYFRCRLFAPSFKSDNEVTIFAAYFALTDDWMRREVHCLFWWYLIWCQTDPLISNSAIQAHYIHFLFSNYLYLCPKRNTIFANLRWKRGDYIW